ncbi:MAG: hypothetical protein ACYCO3_10750, partial [Mycobacteriales bacterium]
MSRVRFALRGVILVAAGLFVLALTTGSALASSGKSGKTAGATSTSVGGATGGAEVSVSVSPLGPS